MQVVRAGPLASVEKPGGQPGSMGEMWPISFTLRTMGAMALGGKFSTMPRGLGRGTGDEAWSVQRRLTAGFKNHFLCPSKASCRLFHQWEAEGLNVTLAGRGSGQKEIRKERKRNTLKTSLSWFAPKEIPYTVTLFIRIFKLISRPS